MGSKALWTSGVAAIMAMTAPVLGQQQPVTVVAPPPAAAPAPETGTRLPITEEVAQILGYLPDETTRMTVPVDIDGQGPFRFVVDTGAERTVISRELARTLDLDPGRTATVHSMTEVSEIATVVIPDLRIAGRSVNDIHAPALSQGNLGAQGMLGVDSLQSQRVMFDFKRREMTIVPSRRREVHWPDDGTIVVTGRRHFGRLMLVDASIEGQRVVVIVDTGSQVTVGNTALRRALTARNRLGALHPIELLSITGGQLSAEYGVAHRIRIGTIDIRDLPIAFADVHPFRQLQLMDRPAILLGMDAMHLFERVSIDFANRRVRVLLPGTSQQIPMTRMAGTVPGVRVAS
jgi:predicted aspartyl protease